MPNHDPTRNEPSKSNSLSSALKSGSLSSVQTMSISSPAQNRSVDNQGVIVLDSESEGFSDTETIRRLSAGSSKLDLTAAYINSARALSSSATRLGSVSVSDLTKQSQKVESKAGTLDKTVPVISAPGSQSSASTRKPKANTTIKKQLVPLTETPDDDFASDAIITTVHTPATPRSSKFSRFQQLELDQHDESLQLALAISMSDQSYGFESGQGSSAGSPFNPSRTPIWSMPPARKLQKGSKRKRQTERERNKSTVLPYAEVQELVQANVHALLFPESDDSNDAYSSTDLEPDQLGGHGSRTDRRQHIGTPPWRPSRFTGSTEADLRLSQSPGPDAMTSPRESLWKLSHLEDTQDIESLDLHITDPHDEGTPGYFRGQRGEDNEPRRRFDREKYVSQFMKRYLQRDREGHEKTSDSTKQDPEDSVTLSGSGSKDDQRPLDNKV
ncbi:hypothetical protein BC939DRAFT_455910, partial [Gamsiella multidivaricata]|uniref:uncharacterized protein n=1 Tax=Gamsiella multidivaricata TaxID=101098 RepID=UPI00221F604D